MYKIVFSIAAHEKYETIVDLIENFNKFNSDSAIIIHLSLGFVDNSLINEKTFLNIISKYKNVYLNPNRQRTSLYSQLLTHYSNFCYAKDIIDFEYFSLNSSNDMYLKKGFYDYINGVDCLLEYRKMKKSQWAHYNKFMNDELIQSILQKNNIHDFYLSYMEGTAYKKELFERICENFNMEVLQKYSYKYPVDEAIITSLSLKYSAICKNGRAIKNGIGRLYVNHRIIMKVGKQRNKFGAKRINRDFYNYQRVFIRKNITKNDCIYKELELNEIKIGKIKYLFIDLFWTIRTIIEKILSYMRFKFRLLFRKKKINGNI